MLPLRFDKASRNAGRVACCRVLLFLLLTFACACAPPPVAEEPLESGSTGVTGEVLRDDGSPAAGAFVYAYRTASQGLRGPADFGVRVDRDGHYFLDLVAGEYHLVARLRQTGADAGPPRPGDAWSIHDGNPVRVAAGQIGTVDFILQAGSVPRQVRQGSLVTGTTGFRGRLVDAEGRPFAGAFALAYRSTDFHRMPDLTSMPAAADGRFTLYVSDPGRYCLAARSQTRGQPRAGEPYGVLDNGEDPCLSVQEGEIIDVGTLVLKPHR